MNTFHNFQQRYIKYLSDQFGREKVCPFWGNQNAKIVSISQAPSASVIKNQKPFSDKSGERLRSEWYKVSDEEFYNPDNFYFTAVGMYYPGKNPKGGDLKPSLDIANKWLREEISYLNPELFLIIGGLSAKFFFPHKSLSELAMNDQEVNNTQALVLPHPSPINIAWFKKHPEFESSRVPEISKIVKKSLHKQ